MMMKPERLRPAFSLVALFTLLVLSRPASAQQSDDEWLDNCRRERDDRYAWCDVRVERLSARSALRVDAGRNGGVQVIGGSRSDIEVHARIQARARSRDAAADLGEAVRLDMGNTIRSDGPSTGDEESWYVSYVVFVPARIDLSVEANNGPVSIEGVSGDIEASTRNGPLGLRDLSGDVRARTQNGPLDVWLTGSHWEGAGLDAETHNGPVNLAIPEGYSARLETGTRRGPFNTDVPLTVTRLGRMERRIETTLGSGGAPIRAVTTNGPVSIRSR